MTGKRQTSEYSRKRRNLRFAAFLMFFYLIGNLTVLEYFGGNPDLGIISYTQIATTISTEVVSVQNASNNSQSSRQDNESGIQLDGDDCLASCTHCILGVVPIEIRQPVLEEHFVNQITRHLYPKPHPTSFYRPPRTV